MLAALAITGGPEIVVPKGCLRELCVACTEVGMQLLGLLCSVVYLQQAQPHYACSKQTSSILAARTAAVYLQDPRRLLAGTR
jgi:hypothetical protein